MRRRHALWEEVRPENLKAASRFDLLMGTARDYAREKAVEKHLMTLQTLAICCRFVPSIYDVGLRSGAIKQGKHGGLSFFERFSIDFIDGVNSDASRVELEKHYCVETSQLVTYVTAFGHVRGVKVAKDVYLKCTNEMCQLSAADFGAFASSPRVANLSDGHELFWFDRKFLDAYAELNHGAAFVTQTHLKPAFDLLSGYSISRDMLSNVVREYRASIRDLTTRELDVYGVQVADAERADPWRHCPACAMVASHADEDATEDEDGAVLCHMVDSETLGSESSEHATGIKQMLRDAGNHLGRVIHSVAFDAVAKSVRLTMGRTKDIKLKPIVSDFFTPTAAVDANSTQPASGDVGNDGALGDEPEDVGCEQHIRASRDPTANIRGSPKLIEHCLAAGVCHHGLVGYGCVVASDRPEHFGLYHGLLNDVIIHRGGRLPTYVCIDNGCQYGPSWSRVFPHLAQTFGKLMRFCTGSWHGAAHKLTCRLKNSVTFALGAARRHGEGTEQLWSFLKPLFRSTKFMSHANNRFAVEEGIVSWNTLKLQTMNTKFEDWLKDLPEKFEALDVEMENIYKKAREQQGLREDALRKCASELKAYELGTAPVVQNDGDEMRSLYLLYFHDSFIVTHYGCGDDAEKVRNLGNSPLGVWNNAAIVLARVKKARKRLKRTTDQLDKIRDERKATYASFMSDEDMCAIQETLDKDKTNEETTFKNEFVVKKVAKSRRDCEYLFEERRLIQADLNRAFQTGEGRTGSVPHLRGRKTSNWKRIETLLRTQVEFWEKEYCQLNGVLHTDYPLDVMNSWRCDDTYFPVWTDLLDNEGNLIVMPDGCPNAMVRNLALRHLIVTADKERMKEEAVLLRVELARVTRFHKRRASVLETASDAKEDDLLASVLSKANDDENLEEDENHEVIENQSEDGTAHDLFLHVVGKLRETKFIVLASQEMESVEGLDWKQYNAIFIELAGVKAMLSRARAAMEAPVLGDKGDKLVRKTLEKVT